MMDEATLAAIQIASATLGWPSGPRPAQLEVLEPLFAGRNVLAILPTSAGKSGIFQIPTMARPGLTIVISPLVALMADQVQKLTRRGVAAYVINNHSSAMDRKAALSAIEAGTAKFLYLSPERLTGMTEASFGASKIQMIAVDEAHCISEWGHDFRPAYMRLGKTLSKVAPGAQIVALTATATDQVAEEICRVLPLGPDPVKIVKSPNRSNITYGVAGSKYSVPALVEIGGLPSLVYGSTRVSVEEAAVLLQRSGVSSAAYHAGMPREQRMQVQDDFLAGKIDVVCATNAFGMGVDHAGIRSVIHLEMPTSLEAYMQESGRAGRDGLPSIAICRATLDTLSVARSMVGLSWPTPNAVRDFWRKLLPLFLARPGKSEGDGRIQLTNKEIADRISGHEAEVGSCIRILHDADVLHRVAYQDRPVSVRLLSGSKLLKGSKQRQVVARLEDHADASGEVSGSVAFFWNVIGLDRAYAVELNERNAIRFTWVDKCQLLEQRVFGPDIQIDDDLIHRIRRRALARIDRSGGYLSNLVTCRRQYLLAYFGVEAKGEALGRCCDRCPPLAPAPSTSVASDAHESPR